MGDILDYPLVQMVVGMVGGFSAVVLVAVGWNSIKAGWRYVRDRRKRREERERERWSKGGV